MPLPNFFIIGAAKSGTTSLWAYLNQHSDVYLSRVKEPNYFALAGETLPDGGPVEPHVLLHLVHPSSVTDHEKYCSLFANINDRRAVGEASVRYLYYEKAARRIRDHVPNARLIAILREPVARLYSHYWMNVQYQLEPLPLLAALDAEDERVAAGWGWDWHYTRVSSYANQVKRYFDVFDREQIKIFLYQDFLTRPMDVFRDVCRHLGINDRFVPDMTKRAKVTTRPRHLALDRWLNWPSDSRERVLNRVPRGAAKHIISGLNKLNSRPVPKLDNSLKKELHSRFRGDIEALEHLIGRSTGWLSGATNK